VRAYLELHIEQGPVLERLGLPLGAGIGTFGAEDHLFIFRGQTAHCGATPMEDRRDAFLAAARFALEVREIARSTGGGAVTTTGGVTAVPGIATAVAGECTITIDQRHLDAAVLAQMLAQARAAADRIAADERVEVAWEPQWRVQPALFDDRLIELCEESIVEVAGQAHRFAGGPVHDASVVANAGIPTAMLFVQSLNGLSHTPLEDTKPEHLELAVQALDRLVTKTVELVA
jgi:N-carbamoyl-L-amino-acid hydrolase